MVSTVSSHGRWRHAIRTLVVAAGLAACTSTTSASDDAHAAAQGTIGTVVDAADPAERVGDYLDGRVLDIMPAGPASRSCSNLPHERLVDYLDGRVLDFLPADQVVCPAK